MCCQGIQAVVPYHGRATAWQVLGGQLHVWILERSGLLDDSRVRDTVAKLWYKDESEPAGTAARDRPLPRTRGLPTPTSARANRSRTTNRPASA